jgi:hypothetical protein
MALQWTGDARRFVRLQLLKIASVQHAHCEGFLFERHLAQELDMTKFSYDGKVQVFISGCS